MACCSGCTHSNPNPHPHPHPNQVHGLLLQLHAPLCALGFTYQEIRQSLTDMMQLLQLLRRQPQVKVLS